MVEETGYESQKNIKVEDYRAVVYVGSSLTVHNPLTKTYNKGFPNHFTLITMLYCIHLCFMFSLATPPTVEEILDKMNYDLVMSLTVEAPVSTIYR